MKKLSTLLLSIAMLFALMVPVSAAYRSSEPTNEVRTKFFVQRFGAQMDESGNVTSRNSSFFTKLLYETELTKQARPMNYSKVFHKGSVSSDDVISEVVNKPNDADIMAKIKEMYQHKGYILSSNGKVVKWRKFDTNHYELCWYVLKLEEVWHVDGVVVEKDTKKPIEIPLPEDPDYIPPENLPQEEDDEEEKPYNPEIKPEPDVPSNGTAFEYTSNYAYIYGYNDDIMAAESNLKRSEVSAMVHRLVKQNNKLGDFVYDPSATPVFSDTAGEWFRSGIEYNDHKGAFPKGDKVYPYAEVTRGETFRIICLGLGFSENPDLTEDDYAKILFDAGYIQGDENGNLNIPDLITRAEFCSIYNRIIGRENAKLVTADGTPITAKTYGFTDLTEDKWYYETVLRATSAYDDNGFVDIDLRNRRNVLDDYT